MRINNNDTNPPLCTCIHTNNVCWFHYSEYDVFGDSLLTDDIYVYNIMDNKQILLGITSHTESIVFISWRYPLSLILGQFRSTIYNNNKLELIHHNYLWVHDLLPHIALPSILNNSNSLLLRKLFVQSSYHKYSLPEYLNSKYMLLYNGISISLIKNVQNSIINDYFINNNINISAIVIDDNMKNMILNNILNNDEKYIKFIYGSAPNRGLEDILKIWPFIKLLIPNAEFHIYYGFG